MAGGHDSIDKLISQGESGVSSNKAKSAPNAKQSSLNQYSSVEKKHQFGGFTGPKPITPGPQGFIPGGGVINPGTGGSVMDYGINPHVNPTNDDFPFGVWEEGGKLKKEGGKVDRRGQVSAGGGKTSQALKMQGGMGGKSKKEGGIGVAEVLRRIDETGHDKDTGYKYKTPKYYKRKYEESLKKKKKALKEKGNLA